MKLKTVVMVLLLAFVAASVATLVYQETRAKRRATTEPAPGPATPTAAEPGDRVVAYYFHGTQRCQTCLSIERQAKDTIETTFGEDLRRRRLEFRPVNLDETQNRHFVQDYQLETRSLVLVLFQDGRPQRWKALNEVWVLVSDPDRFQEYVRKEVQAFLQETLS